MATHKALWQPVSPYSTYQLLLATLAGTLVGIRLVLQNSYIPGHHHHVQTEVGKQPNLRHLCLSWTPKSPLAIEIRFRV